MREGIVFGVASWESHLSFSCREKERKLEELRAEKTAFQAGLWNPNCILMGGLGSDPSLPLGEIW